MEADLVVDLPTAGGAVPKPHLSASQIETYLQCPRRWAYRYIRGIRSPGSGATAQGSAWHAAIEHGYREVIAGGALPSVRDLQEVFAVDLAERLDLGLAEPAGAKEAVRLRDGETREALLAEGLALVKCHREEIAPRVHPIAVEQRIHLPLGDQFPFDLVGFLDVVARDDDGRTWIRDNKSRSKRRGTPKQPDVDRDVQLTLYSILYRATTQQLEDGLALDCVIKPASYGAPRAIVCETWRTQRDLMWVLGLIEQMARAIWAEAYPPCGGGAQAWWCSEKWCDHWQACMGEAPSWPGAGERLPGLPRLFSASA